jgi:leader peptidase (prepilin peptidase)/N-methyltransferase
VIPLLIVASIVYGAASAAAWQRRAGPAVPAAVAAGLLALAYGPVPVLLVVLSAVPVAARLAETDLREFRLPDPLVGGLALTLGAPLTVAAIGAAGRALVAATVVGLSYLVIALLPAGVLGLGDVKLATVLAYALGFAGWPAVLLGALVAHLVGGAIAAILLLERRAGGRTPVPFGPALLIGALVGAVVTAA